MMTLPGGDVFGHDRPFRVIGIKSLQAGADKLDLAGLGLKPLQYLLGVVRRQGAISGVSFGLSSCKSPEGDGIS